MPHSDTLCCHLFCTVIDNFGDIGVSWRLSRILHNELGWQVTLWLDDETALRTLCPDLPALPCRYAGIGLKVWREGGRVATMALPCRHSHRNFRLPPS